MKNTTIYTDSRPRNKMLIAGPCSAESREQVLQIAAQLNEISIDYFRAGIWKPRTRPNSFEGVGSKGLSWLREVKENFAMKCCIEVANPEHVELALKAGIDVLWIGARTTTNPFAVQEIADALKGVKIPVWIKNPINPDLKLWLGAIERIQLSGVEEIAAIHRGFSTYDSGEYRNDPLWEIPLKLKEEIPEMKIICDPSHIAGKREYIPELCQESMRLNLDGLMIESHPDPKKAWTDAAQQINPQQLTEIISDLNWEPKADCTELDILRTCIDRIDDQLIQQLGVRATLSQKIGMYKKQNHLSAIQNKRWEELLKRNQNLGVHRGLSAEYIAEIFEIVHRKSVALQEKQG